MGRVDPRVPAFVFRQSGAELQRIFDIVARLDASDINAVLDLLNEIRNISHGDDDESIGQQLINAFNSMVKETEVQTELNDSTYPPQTKVVTDAINAHKTATELDHPDGSVKERHIASDAVGSNAIKDSAVRSNHIATNAITQDKIVNKAISKTKLSEALQNTIDGAVSNTDFMNKISAMSKAPKYCLSALLRDTGAGYDIPEHMLDECIIIKNDTTQDFDDSNPIPYSEVSGWEITNKHMYSDKSYLCILRDFRDTGDDTVTYGTIEVIMELGSDIVNTGGVWHGGDELTHTENAVPKNISGAKARDFYLNTETFGVYFTHDGKLWNYIGNLNGSIDTSTFASVNSPNFTGVPTAPTATVTNNSSQIATTEFVYKVIKETGVGGSSSNNGDKEFSGQITFDNLPDVKIKPPEIIYQELVSIDTSDMSNIIATVKGSVKWNGQSYTAEAVATFNGNPTSGDEKITNIYIKHNPKTSENTIIYDYDSSCPACSDYIIIPTYSVWTKRYDIDDVEVVGTPSRLDYTEEFNLDTLVLKSQLDERDKRIAELESRIAALEETIGITS